MKTMALAPGAGYQKGAGFTLIEVIITIVIAALLATMLYSYFGTAITGSATPVTRLGAAMAGQSVMENITADYMASYTSNLTGLQSKIGTEGSSINASYGQGTVVDNHFINWSAGSDVKVASGNCLKVTVKDGLGETLTQIYTSGSQGVNCQ